MRVDGFVVSDDMFGSYVKIPTGASGNMHIYKVIGRIDSNGYCDIPIMAGKRADLHSEIVPVLNVVHCGVSEDTVIRVALSDCEIVRPLNAPLTLDELREMDGEPVWWWNTTQKPSCTICVFKKYMPEPTFVTYDFAREDESKIVKYSRMKKWGYKPYRRKPEEGTT